MGSNLDNRQYGALRQRSTTHALVDMLHHWHAIDKGQSVRSVFIDFAKAFDHVDHNILVDKLVALSLPDVIVRWICAFLQERRQRVKIRDVLHTSWEKTVTKVTNRRILLHINFRRCPVRLIELCVCMNVKC